MPNFRSFILGVTLGKSAISTWARFLTSCCRAS